MKERTRRTRRKRGSGLSELLSKSEATNVTPLKSISLYANRQPCCLVELPGFDLPNYKLARASVLVKLDIGNRATAPRVMLFAQKPGSCSRPESLSSASG